MVQTTLRYRLVSALLAVLMWGSWAYYINSGGGHQHGLISGMTQGLTSFVVTLLVVHSVTRLYNWFVTRHWQLILPTLLTMCAIATTLTTVHHLVGTPHILITIGPSMSVALGFCAFTTYRLSRRGSTGEA